MMRLTELIANLCGVFDVDLDTEFADDGYRDVRGRAPLGEPFFISDMPDEPLPAARPVIVVGRGA